MTNTQIETAKPPQTGHENSESLPDYVNRKMTQSKCFCAFAIVLLLLTSVAAVSEVGFLLGWLTGISKSPVVPAIAPLIFGLLAVLGVGITMPRIVSARNAIWQAIFVAILALVFCIRCFHAVSLGTWQRSDQYSKMEFLLGEKGWDNANDNVMALLYKLRLEARRAGMSADDFEPVIRNVVAPILEDDESEKFERIKQALEIIEPAVTSVVKIEEPPSQRIKVEIKQAVQPAPIVQPLLSPPGQAPKLIDGANNPYLQPPQPRQQ